jgi:thiol:disulfide interchange protein DsbD
MPESSKTIAFCCISVFLLLVLCEPANAGENASELSDRQPVRVRLVSDMDQVKLQEEFLVGVLFEMAPGWHIFWTYPGNTGKPTQVDFSSDEQYVRVLEPQFPAPQVFNADKMEDLSFGYSGSVLITAGAVAYELPRSGFVSVGATLSWVACKQSCIFGKTGTSLDIKVGDQSRVSEWKERIAKDRAKVPMPAGENQAWLESLKYENGEYRLRFILTGFGSVDSFIPRWLTSTLCKVTDYGIGKDKEGRTVAHLSIAGTRCLPVAGGIVTGREAGLPEGAPLNAFEITARKQGESETQGNPETPEPGMNVGEDNVSLWLMLLFAFLGGLLLNIMPCVIPVIVPKLLSVAQAVRKAENPGEKRKILWLNSLAYTAGVSATMFGLGMTIVLLKIIGCEVGWGFQFQNPWFMVFMITLLVVLGLGMLGVFSLKSSTQTEDLRKLRKRRRESPLIESFFTGLLVTFLGTPCTAPLLGPALGYAFTAPDLTIILFLLVVGLGLSMPFIILGVWTGWTLILPKRVTERYDRVMRFLAFFLFGTAIWLLDVLADTYGTNASMNMIWFLLVLSFAAWIFGLVTKESDSWKLRLLKLLPIAVLVASFGAWMLDFSKDVLAKPYGLSSGVGINWKSFSEGEVSEMRSSGKTVFIDFTAAWCLNCRANEQLFIETRKTKSLFDAMGVVAVKAFLTRPDPVAQKWLKRFGRAGVPMYLILPACSDDSKSILLPEILTSDILHEAIKRAGPSKKSCTSR